MKILVIRFSSIGDIVLTTPVIRCLKTQLPEAEIHMLTRKSFYPIVEANPYIDTIHLHDGDIASTIASLKAESFDYIIDLHRNIRTLKVKSGLKAKSFSFDKLNIRKWLYTNFKINTMPPVHIVDRYLDTVKPLGVTNDGKGLDYFIPEKDRVQDSDLPLPHRVAYAGVVIGAALATKQMPVEKIMELCSLIEFPIVLLGGPEDKENGEKIAALNPEKIYNACGKFKLNESADLVRKAKLIITHDTGLMHVAAAFKKPIISIWGNTVPDFGMNAYYGSALSLETRFEVTGLSCRPCSKIGYKKCPRGHFKCMQNQPVQTIALTANKFLLG